MFKSLRISHAESDFQARRNSDRARIVEWNGIFRLFRFSGILGQPREVHPKFRNEIPENVCSIRSPSRNFRNFWSNGKRSMSLLTGRYKLNKLTPLPVWLHSSGGRASHRYSRRSRVLIPLKPWFFQGFRLENLLRWSSFTFSSLLYHNWANQAAPSFRMRDELVSSFHIDYHSLHKWHNWIVWTSKRKITAQDKISNWVCWSENCARGCRRTSPRWGPRGYFIRKQGYPVSIGRSGKTWQ